MNIFLLSSVWGSDVGGSRPSLALSPRSAVYSLLASRYRFARPRVLNAGVADTARSILLSSITSDAIGHSASSFVFSRYLRCFSTDNFG
ncbi:MAG: hypothetical protein J5884_07130 [Paludibacteraceae bacterium]|nr:hypothetical protein [Paludibacteraceae bacterium]